MIKKVIQHPLFWIFLAAKLFLFLTWPSVFVTDLFIPFLDHALLHPTENPWSSLPARNFPYGSVLFAIMIVPKALFYALFGQMALGSTLLSFAAVRLPILIVDILFLLLLFRFPGQRDKESLYVHYWLNPVLIFICYAHGQLDIFAVFFVFLALYFIKTKQEMGSSVALACAILCKFHVVLLIPLFLAYFWRTKYRDEAWPFLSKWSAVVLGLCTLGFLPHLLSERLGDISVASPEAMKIFALSFTLDTGVQLYFGIGIVVAVLTRLILSSRMSEEGLLYASGLILGLLLVTTSSMPGWYFWLYPFLALFMSQYVVRLQGVLMASYVFYLLHFLPTHLGWLPPTPIPSLSFTLLQMSLLGLLIGIWQFVIRFEMPWHRRQRPLMVGIAGDSGAGKNTISKTFFELLGEDAVTVVEGDDYHKWERGAAKWQDYTHLNPRANHLETFTQNVARLAQGRPVSQSHYDHQVGQFTDERLITSQKNIIVQGLHALYPIYLRRMMDIKIFIKPHDELRLFWKLQRDHRDRGHSLEAVVKAVEERKNDSQTHIAPQMGFSDWVVEYWPVDTSTFHALTAFKNNSAHLPELRQIHRLLNDAPVDALLASLQKISTLSVQSENDPGNLDFIQIEVRGQISAQEVAHVAQEVFPSVRQLTRSNIRPKWRADLDGINQLLFLAMVQRSEAYL